MLPQEALLPWAMLNDVDFNRTVPGVSVGKGGALLAKEGISSDDAGKTLLTVPRDLILSLETLLEHAKVDKDFRELLDCDERYRTVGTAIRSPSRPPRDMSRSISRSLCSNQHNS